MRLIVIPFLLIAGCTSVTDRVTIGDRHIRFIERSSLWSPSLTVMVTTDMADRVVLSIEQVGGESWAGTIIPGASLVWAAHEVEGTNVKTMTNTSNDSRSAAVSNADANATVH